MVFRRNPEILASQKNILFSIQKGSMMVFFNFFMNLKLALDNLKASFAFFYHFITN